jgi:DNA helicase HerA-like ATPase/predicted DNA-binding transcriptional regulator
MQNFSAVIMAEAFIGSSDKKKILFPLNNLTRHFIALGSSGSGKTVLCKAIIEEAARNSVPSIIIDSQGDLASLALAGEKDILETKGIGSDMIDSFQKSSRVVIFTPSSSKGIPVCINPLKLPEADVEEEDLISLVKEISNSVASLLGYSDDDAGDAARSLIYNILRYCYDKKIKLNDFEDLISYMQNIPQEIKQESSEIVSEKDIQLLIKRLRLLTTGGKELLFNFGVPLDIGNLVKKGQISVFYINTLRSDSEKQFFISALAANLYNWMLLNPSKDLQLLFYIDEISGFLPAGARKPPAKEILNLIYKQARKYGVGCIVSTQNPGDIDYRAFAQFNSWAIGRLTTKQDIAKVKGALSSVSSKFSDVLGDFPKLKPAEFFLFSPDYSESIIKFRSRYLITAHKTLTAEDISGIIKPEARKEFEKHKISASRKLKAKTIDKEYIAPSLTKDNLTAIIDKLKRKSFVFFGTKREHIDYARLLLIPVYLCNVRRRKKMLLRERIEEFNICFDAVTGDILSVRDGKLRRLIGFNKLISMKELDISIIRELFSRKRMMNLAELYSNLKISGSIVKSALNRLMKENIIILKEDKFGIGFEMNLPHDISKLHSSVGERSKDAVEAEFIDKKIDFSPVKDAFERFFRGSEIVDSTIIHYPMYEIKLSTKRRSRIRMIDAVSGRLLE